MKKIIVFFLLVLFISSGILFSFSIFFRIRLIVVVFVKEKYKKKKKHSIEKKY